MSIIIHIKTNIITGTESTSWVFAFSYTQQEGASVQTIDDFRLNIDI